MTEFSRTALVALAALSMIGAGCKKRVANNPPPPPQQTASAATGRPSTPTTARSTPTPAERPATGAPSRVPDAATRARIDELLAKIEDAYFDYNKATLRPDAIQALQGDSKELRDIIVQYPDYKLTIEGHADERGSEEYNRALGDARAKSAEDYLAGVGIPKDQLSVISYGKDKPLCEEHNETCWQKNRRIHIVGSPK